MKPKATTYFLALLIAILAFLAIRYWPNVLTSRPLPPTSAPKGVPSDTATTESNTKERIPAQADVLGSEGGPSNEEPNPTPQLNGPAAEF